MNRAMRIRAHGASLGDCESYQHVAKDLEFAEQLLKARQELRDTLTQQGHLTPAGIAAKVNELMKAQLKEIEERRGNNRRRVEQLLKPAKKPAGELPQVDNGRAQRLVDLWRYSTGIQRQRLMTDAITGSNADLAVLMMREPDLFGITDETVIILKGRAGQLPDEVDEDTQRELHVAELLEEELAALTVEIAPPPAKETPAEQAARLRGDAA